MTVASVGLPCLKWGGLYHLKELSDAGAPTTFKNGTLERALEK